MIDAPNSPADCASCGYWRVLRGQVGNCHRRAPAPAHIPEQAAHWPQTNSNQWCGDGAVAAETAPGATCADCFYWRQPSAGLNPLDRKDMPMAWWTHAGYCARHAPEPVSEPGARAFWRATHGTDCCAEGRPRNRGETDAH